MYNILHKYKGVFIFILKGLFVFAALFFIVYKVTFNSQISFSTYTQQISNFIYQKNWIIIILLIFTFLNWWLESLKWKILVSTLKIISIKEASIQTLVSHTIGFTTPNKIGEYGAKALFFKKSNQKKIVALNFIGNTAQLTVTLFFGFIGMVFLILNFTIPKLQIILSKSSFVYILTIIIFLLIIKNFSYKKLMSWFKKLQLFFNTISTKTYVKILLLATLRYAIFANQFYFFLWIFGIQISYTYSMLMLFCMYLIASVIPNLNLFDWAIKGSIAVFLFGLLGVSPLPIIIITTSMWLLNFALPAIIGSGFMLFYKPIFN